LVPAPKSEDLNPTQAFVALSAALTGFREVDLWGTGQAGRYLDELIRTVGDAIVARLLVTGGEAVRTGRLQALVMDDRDLGPLARNVIALWYLGQWYALPNDWRNRNGASPRDVQRVISADAYASGLVWRAAGAHPMGAKPPGYGSWANPPAAGS
jgi:hypothetical protein